MIDDHYTRLNQYKSMWVLVLFDLPTDTKKDRRIAGLFRKELLNDGFAMFQFSIYARFCASRENMEVHINRVQKCLPEHGKISIMQFTDRQFGLTKIFYGKKPLENEKPSQQLELF
jgi:CRISPR-associated protein Cas2